ncbi:piwi-like protein 1 [Ornithodoros turicata]|uniref:piwi-like protein 1 n=1 Tax=Ornithodoros turicata TaxID=34597 RepID=UPI0031395505
MEENEFKSCGRGGRGARLLAALQQVRRPGEIPSDGSGDAAPAQQQPSTSTAEAPLSRPSPTLPPVAGRGALLEKLMLQSRSSSAASSDSGTTKVAPGRGLLTALGRSIAHTPVGRGILAQIRPPSEVGSTSSVTTTPAPSVTASSRASPEPPVEEMQQLVVKEFRGKSGKPVPVEVNYVRLETMPGMGVYEYHVDFNPPMDSKNVRFQLIRSDPVVEAIGRTKVFDGAKLYLPVKLPNKVTSIGSQLRSDGSAVMVHIKFVKKTPPSQCVHLYNVLFKKVLLCLQLTQIGRNYFDHKGRIPIPQHRLEVWPGYIQSVGEYEGGLLLNCDASFRVLRTITARDILFEIYNAAPKDYKTKAVQALVGSIVMTRYNNKTYRIDDISWDLKPTSSFSARNGEEITYMDYYKKMYNIQISDTAQPLLIHRPKERKGVEAQAEEQRLICLVPELCLLTGLTDEMRADHRIMKDIAGHTRVNPTQRQHALMQFVKRVNDCPEAMKVLGDWGVKLYNSAVTLDGRILQEEKIMMKSKSYFHKGTADWGRLLSQDSVIRAVNLESWVVIFSKRDTQRAKGFMEMMSRICPSMGIQVQQPLTKELPSDSTDSYLRAIKDVLSQRTQVVVCIFPTSRDDRYSAVKRLCCVDMPVPSQVIISNTIGKPDKLRSVVQKIALQINCKLGGELWAVEVPMTNVMVIGVDVYHDTTKANRSVLGFVASLNQPLTRWFSKCSFQDKGKELVNCLKISMLEAIVKYYEVNHKRPDRIFFFRDGVGDGQLSYVSEFEVDQLIQSFVNISPDYSPKVAVVVVQKRINTRIFAKVNRGELDNPMPGTVVDHTVTRREWYDFFLVSQKVRQGTVTPTHYVVVRNTTELSPDQMQRLSYKLTHLYYNWPGTVRVPAPCQYAHKLAYLVGDNIHREPSSLLSDRLFYL